MHIRMSTCFSPCGNHLGCTSAEILGSLVNCLSPHNFGGGDRGM